MIADVVAAAVQTLSPPFRSILWRSLALTLVMLALGFLGLDRLLFALLPPSPDWIRASLQLLAGAGFIFCAPYLIGPIAALVAGFYAEDLAALAEATLDPGRVGRPIPAGQALWAGARFALLALVVNLLALALLFVPGINVIAFFGANAYLLGRVSFELAAMRRKNPQDAVAFYRRHAASIFAYGLWIALLLSIPVANLLTPSFAIALMVRLYDRLERGDSSSASGATEIG